MSLARLHNAKGSARTPAGAPSQTTKTFPYQSYYDASFEALTPTAAAALLEQQTNNGIIRSTVTEQQSQGYAIGNAPWSEAPIAVRVQTGGNEGGGYGSAIILRPGETLAPVGLSRGDTYVNFNSLEWGLPFGWLGGGLCTLFVFKSPDSVPDWGYGAREVMFHCFRTAIRTASLVAPAKTNWPTRFPWGKAFRGSGSNALSQTGTPNIAVEPTRTVLRLRGTSLGAAADCRLVMWGSDELDHGSDGLTPTNSETAYWEFAWPANTSGGWVAHQQFLEVPGGINGLAANSWGISLEALAASGLVGASVDVLRYGRV